MMDTKNEAHRLVDVLLENDDPEKVMNLREQLRLVLELDETRKATDRKLDVGEPRFAAPPNAIGNNFVVPAGAGVNQMPMDRLMALFERMVPLLEARVDFARPTPNPPLPEPWNQLEEPVMPNGNNHA